MGGERRRADDGVMNDTSSPEAPPRRLTRSSSDRLLAGVCGGLGDYTGIDPVVFRVVFAVAAILGGAGLAAYLVAWLVIPKEDGSQAGLDPARSRDLPVWLAVVLGVVALALIGSMFGGHGPFFHGGFGLLVLVGFALWLWVRHEDRAASPRPPAPAPATSTLTGDLPEPTTPIVTPSRQRERSPLGLATVSAALLVAGLLAAIAAAGADVTAGAVLASALITVGAGLLVGSRWGRARLLVPVGIVLVFAAAVATVADVPFRGGAGERTWRPTTLAELESTYRLGFGHAVLDLRDLQLDGTTRHVTVTLGMGRLEVWLPDGTRLSVRGHVGGGRIEGFGDDSGGTDVSRTYVRGADDVSTTAGELRIDAKLGFGRLDLYR